MSLELPRIPEYIDLPAEEDKILTLWNKLDVFNNCLKQSKGKPKYSFYDGPPFATGLPHYGHILACTIKDVVTRFAHQSGYHVERRFGWDCHGLPVEFEIDKMLGITGPEDVMKMGIAAYNSECRKIVDRYIKEWEVTVGRIGRWIDFKNDYKTLYPWYMESIWWVFKQLYLKGLVYKGIKVMPYSTSCSTPISNFEAGQNYKDVVDPAVTVSLQILNDKDAASLLIWTTTPWTLPSNMAVCVNGALLYVRVQEISSGKVFILMKARVEFVFKSGDYKILAEFLGKTLLGLHYKPLFSYYEELGKKLDAFKVLNDDYVSEDSGTGVVHQAPYFGEDDFRVCLAAGIITAEMEPVCPIDASGRFTKPVNDFEGQYCKDADKNIIAILKSTNRLFNLSQVKHSYPFCWRSDTPLIYKAVPSWFVRVQHMSQELQNATDATYWVPEFVKEKRFGNWIRNACDWAVSRNRYWGTPLPIWVSPETDEIYCVGSIKELEELTGAKITDLHRESIDHLVIPSKIPGNPPLHRISEVFDCWFESGSMPYAQQHYPFENQKDFLDQFPADFIGEGIDQTRGWFYTLTVISTALFGKSPFKNLIANGLILASDGQKMSKRKKNYPDPTEIISKYGADALRLYLINSPVVRAENLRFKEDGVRDTIKDILLPLYNAFRFLMQNIEVFSQENNAVFHYKHEEDFNRDNIMDQWIVSYTQSLLQHVHKEMTLYHLYNVVPKVVKYVDQLTNWYVRMNRKRLKGVYGVQDCKNALTTLFSVLFNAIQIMAPFAPFLTESIYQYMKQLTDCKADSIHYLMLPQPIKSLMNEDVERAISRMQVVIELVRTLRDRKTIPVKYPLPEIVVVHHSEQYISDMQILEPYILSEMNVRKLTVTTNKTKYGITLRAEPDFKILGSRFKQDINSIASGIKALTDAEVNNMNVVGYCEILGHKIYSSEVRLIFQAANLTSSYEVGGTHDVVVLLDVTPDANMQDEGIAREIINRIQKLRKKAHLVPSDQITVAYETSGELARIALSYKEFIEDAIKTPFLEANGKLSQYSTIIEDKQKLKDCSIRFILYENIELPNVKWVNIQLHNITSLYGAGYNTGTVLLSTPQPILTCNQLKHEIASIFGLYNDFALWYNKSEILTDQHIQDLNGSTIVATPSDYKECIIFEGKTVPKPFCKSLNIGKQGFGTVLLENPVGIPTLPVKNGQNIVDEWVALLKKIST